MKIQLRKLIYENFLQDGYDHIKRNIGKYALGANAAGIYSAGQGYLGSGAKNLYDKASDKIISSYNNHFGSKDGQHPDHQIHQNGPSDPSAPSTHPLHDLEDDHDHLMESDNTILNHFKNNAGKYVAGEAALLGGTYAAGKGYLGVGPQDAVQDFVGNTAAKLENLANANHIKGSKDAFNEIYSKPDNLFASGTERELTNTVQNALQKEHYLGGLQNGVANTLREIGSLTNSPDTINYMIRNPGETIDHSIGHIALATKAMLPSDN